MAVILFDGVCNLCNRAVQWVIKNDPKGYFQFATRQSEQARPLLAQHGKAAATDSLVLLENGKVYTESDAVLRIARKLRQPLPLLYVFILVPPFLRHAAYRFLAARRYRWFGRRKQCMRPAPEHQSRFL